MLPQEAKNYERAFTERPTDGRQCLWKMESTGTIALEIALSESVERRMLEM